jgi:hypothetical protein
MKTFFLGLWARTTLGVDIPSSGRRRHVEVLALALLTQQKAKRVVREYVSGSA